MTACEHFVLQTLSFVFVLSMFVYEMIGQHSVPGACSQMCSSCPVICVPSSSLCSVSSSSFDLEACSSMYVCSVHCARLYGSVLCEHGSGTNQIAVLSHDPLSLIPCRSTHNWSLRECPLDHAPCFRLWLGIWHQLGIHSVDLHRCNDTLLCFCIAEEGVSSRSDAGAPPPVT